MFLFMRLLTELHCDHCGILKQGAPTALQANNRYLYAGETLNRLTFKAEQLSLPGNEKACRAPFICRDRLQSSARRDKGSFQP
jgi:hypothetical protein